LIDGSQFLGDHYAPSINSAGVDLDFLRPVRFQPLKLISMMPLLNRASTLSASTRNGSWTVREKLP
jgi:hypothetical protein